MLWEYTQMLLVLAIFFTFMGFWKKIDPFMRVMFIGFAAICYNTVGQGLLNITFKWAGSQNVISYTFIPNEESIITSLFVNFARILLVVAFIRAIDLVQHKTTGQRWMGD